MLNIQSEKIGKKVFSILVKTPVIFKLLLTLLVCFVLLGLFWATAFFVFLLIWYRCFWCIIRIIEFKVYRIFIKITFWGFSALIIVFWFKNFVADTYCVFKNDMNDTLQKNDIIFVNKLCYGPIFPIKGLDFMGLEQKRLKGLRKVDQGDVVLIDFSKDNDYIPLRCVGLPGDLLELSASQIFTNNNLYYETNEVKEIYTFRVENSKDFYSKASQVKANFNRFSNNKLGAYISRKNIEYLKGDISDIKKEIDLVSGHSKLFPKSMSKSLIYGWTLDYYGPILIPKKGMKITMDEYNFMIYEEILKEYEGVDVKKYREEILTNKKNVNDYVFKQDYYFLLADNRKKSLDSRFFGFVPEHKLIGKADCILFSKNDDSFQWDRMFKMI